MAKIEHLCRVCADSSTLLVAMLGNYHDDNGPSLLEMINDIMDYQVDDDDLMPHHICQDCAEATKNAFNLRRKFELSQRYFLCQISRVQEAAIKLEPHEEQGDMENEMYVGPIKIEEPVEKPHICMTCGQCFDTQSQLLQHKLIHMPTEDTYHHHLQEHSSEYICPDCDKSFTRKRYLQRHRLTHTAKRRCFQCPHCPKVYAHRHSLNAHISIHTGEWAFRCPHCENVFAKSSDLKNHMRQHTGEPPPYACPRCPKAFTQRHNLKKHLGMHANDIPITSLTEAEEDGTADY